MGGTTDTEKEHILCLLPFKEDLKIIESVKKNHPNVDFTWREASFNRLTSLPPLRRHFPNLITLFASNNAIKELLPDSVKGLRTLDCSSNDINSLNARLGLLGGPGGLERLDVSGNRFRVPKYTILDKGTEATLAWLRDRIPAGEMSPVESN